MRTLARTALFLAVVLGIHWVAYATVPESPRTLPPLVAGSASASLLPLVACATEDSTNCIWVADSQGNGVGQSFIDIDGIAYHFSE